MLDMPFSEPGSSNQNALYNGSWDILSVQFVLQVGPGCKKHYTKIVKLTSAGNCT